MSETAESLLKELRDPSTREQSAHIAILGRAIIYLLQRQAYAEKNANWDPRA